MRAGSVDDVLARRCERTALVTELLYFFTFRIYVKWVEGDMQGNDGLCSSWSLSLQMLCCLNPWAEPRDIIKAFTNYGYYAKYKLILMAIFITYKYLRTYMSADQMVLSDAMYNEIWNGNVSVIDVLRTFTAENFMTIYDT